MRNNALLEKQELETGRELHYITLQTKFLTIREFHQHVWESLIQQIFTEYILFAQMPNLCFFKNQLLVK